VPVEKVWHISEIEALDQHKYIDVKLDYRKL